MLMNDNSEHCNDNNNNINDDTKVTYTFAIIIIGIV